MRGSWTLGVLEAWTLGMREASTPRATPPGATCSKRSHRGARFPSPRVCREVSEKLGRRSPSLCPMLPLVLPTVLSRARSPRLGAWTRLGGTAAPGWGSGESARRLRGAQRAGTLTAS